MKYTPHVHIHKYKYKYVHMSHSMSSVHVMNKDFMKMNIECVNLSVSGRQNIG